MSDQALLAGVELGGTKCIAVLARGNRIVAEKPFRTKAPAETIRLLADQLERWQAIEPFKAIGIASFGPLARAPDRDAFTSLANTPKPGWSHAALRLPFADRFRVPIEVRTDVAGAALAEWKWGSAASASSLVYLTLGTGIGGAIVVGGRLIEGCTHPELGHLRVRRADADAFTGNCPFHGDCLEGLASGPAIAARTGIPAYDLPADHPVWAHVALEVAEALASIILMVAPHHILIGGGVGLSPAFPLTAVRRATIDQLGGYISTVDASSIASVVQRATLGVRAGPLGAIALAHVAHHAASSEREHRA